MKFLGIILAGILLSACTVTLQPTHYHPGYVHGPIIVNRPIYRDMGYHHWRAHNPAWGRQWHHRHYRRHW